MRLFNLLTITILLFLTTVKAELRVVTTYPYIASITQEIVKNKAKVDFLASGNLDPHFIIPKPSLAAKLRNADLLIINGASLEIGWLPPLLDQANNSKIRPSTSGFLDLSQYIKLIEKPENASRAFGDVHPEGNPHFYLDPYNIPIISDIITASLCKLDYQNCSFYQTNNNTFKTKWSEKLKYWNSNMEKLKSTKVIEYHKLYDYFINRYGLVLSGTIEPLPGIPPTGKHLENLIEIIKTQNVKLIMQDVYHPLKPAQFLNQKTGIKYVVVPHDVGAVPEAKDIFSLFDEIVKRLTEVNK